MKKPLTSPTTPGAIKDLLLFGTCFERIRENVEDPSKPIVEHIPLNEVVMTINKGDDNKFGKNPKC